eukprot:2852781-Amphidinium_carterae.2
MGTWYLKHPASQHRSSSACVQTASAQCKLLATRLCTSSGTRYHEARRLATLSPHACATDIDQAVHSMVASTM